MEPRRVELPALDFRALVDTIDEEARTVELIFSTGAAVERMDWYSGTRYLEVLSLDPAHVKIDRLNQGGPLLDSHGSYSVLSMLGAVVPGSVKLSKKEARATVRFSKRAEVEPIWQDVKDGLVKSVSVGYRSYAYEETPPKKKDGLPVRTATSWEPFEVSMVSIPADPGARTRGAKPEETHSCEIVPAGYVRALDPAPQPTKESPVEPEITAPATPPATRAATTPALAPVAAPPAPAAGPSTEETRAAAKKEERERALAIRKMVRTAKLEDAVAEDMIGRGIELDAARAEVLDKMAGPQDAAPTSSQVRVGVDARDKWARGVGAWLIQRAGMTDLVRLAQKAKPDSPAFRDLALDPGEFRGMSLFDLARQSLDRAGISIRGKDKLEVAGLAMRDITGVQTTSDFAVALENVLNKVLLAAYTITPDTWRQFCSVGSVVDFRPHPRYRSAFMSRLTVVPEGGEFTNKNIPDTVKETQIATTKGNIISLSRQAIVNDDMSVFSRVAQQIGRAVALSIEMDVYDLLALNAGLGPLMNDGNTLFHASHLNIGTGAALSVASLDADRVVLASQKDPSGNDFLDLRPSVLLIAIGLGGQARVINQSQYDTDIVANKFLVPNKVIGLFDSIVDTPRLTGTRRYLFADPALMPTIEVAFLEGVQEPFMEMQQGWRIDGTEWKVRLDYGVAAIEFRGAETNAGV